MKLIIVESPHKSKTIADFLSKDYKVMASVGHICDLPAKPKGKYGLGIDIEHGFKPMYEVISDPKNKNKDKKGVIKELKKACSEAEEVYLATDPDREGEAIAYHLATYLNLDVKTTPRLEFHEITKNAIEKALENPRRIDMSLVESQEARRVIDRIMGFRWSSLLQKRLKSRSAGRVQSVVLKLVVDREKEIQNFVPEESWHIRGDFRKDDHLINNAELTLYKGKKIAFKNEDEANAAILNLPDDFTISLLKKEIKRKNAPAPFITATLQQAATKRLHITSSRTMQAAQELYDSGHITYLRTDSIRLSDEFVKSAFSFIDSTYGADYIGKAPTQKKKGNVQDAHEAIRPTDLSFTPEQAKGLLPTDQQKVYKLIYERALASLMSAKKEELTTVTLTGNDYSFQASDTKMIFPGYEKLFKSEEDEDKEKMTLPEGLKEGENYRKEKVVKKQHFTTPPSRYDESSLIKLMQEKEIGRPSTYASTVELIKDEHRKYTILDKTYHIIPTEQGTITVENLEEFFPQYMNVTYTAEMENSLDQIADGKVDRLTLLNSFWSSFQQAYSEAEKNMKKIPPKEVEGEVCPECGAKLVYRQGKNGEFIACSRYPECTYSRSIKKEVEVVPDRTCPKCGHSLVYRVRKKTYRGKESKFIGCSNYPECNYMEDLNGNVIDLSIKKEKKSLEIPEDARTCPKCHKGKLILREGKKGKFYGCSEFPRCHYSEDYKEGE